MIANPQQRLSFSGAASVGALNNEYPAKKPVMVLPSSCRIMIYDQHQPDINKRSF
jgi:hypothetical protein